MGKLRQDCAACGLAFNADAKYLGKVVKCPKCGEPVSIVDTRHASGSSVISAKPPAAKPPGSTSSLKTASSLLPAAAPAKPAPAKPEVRADSGIGISIAAAESSVGNSSAALRTRRKNSHTTTLLGMLVLGASVVVILVMVGSLAYVSGMFDDETQVAAAGGEEASSNITQSSDSAPSGDNTRSTSTFASDPIPERAERNEAPSGFGRPGQNWNVLVLDLNDRDRGEVSVSIDGNKHEVPNLGPVMYSLEEGQHQVTLTRPGYEAVEHSFYMHDNAREEFRPLWQREGAGPVAALPQPGAGVVNFDDWLQDMESAKRQAAAQKKDILVAFNGTDWCGWCIRLMNEVFFQREFRQQIDESFVLVHIDSPRGPQALGKVQDRRRNNELIEQFAVSGFPTVILTDAQGQPYAQGGYVEGGVAAFMREISQLQNERQRRDRLFEAVATSTGAGRISAGEQALKWLRDNRVIQHYGPTLSSWLEQAKQNDPKNDTGEYETFFELDWLARIATIDRTDVRVVQPVLARLDDFNRQCKFIDGDRGGRLNLVAAAFMAMHEEFDEALKYAEAGLSCGPRDAEILGKLQRATLALQNSDVVATGTGFVVAKGGYLLTNFHVVEDGVPYVRLPGNDDPVPAKIVAKDEGQDIALLQLNDPALAAGFNPLPVSSHDVGRGARVAVFGYPLSDEVGTGLKLTTGGVSALPDAVNEGMLLLDCRVNPGNSGGPLCDTRGRVIGMVTAKSDVGFGVDSYGMAQPGTVLDAFLKKNLRGYQPSTSPADGTLEWEQVDRQVSGSVLMIVMKES